MKLKIKLLYSVYENEEGIYGLVAEDGEVLYTHYCSNRGYAYGDLYGNRLDRQKVLKERYEEVEIE